MKVNARVQITLDIPANGNWGTDCTVGQIRKQALSDVKLQLHQLLDKKDVRLVGDVKIRAIFTEED